jgi:hypothetical protein
LLNSVRQRELIEPRFSGAFLGRRSHPALVIHWSHEFLGLEASVRWNVTAWEFNPPGPAPEIENEKDEE